MSKDSLSIIAGGGRLPVLVAQAARAAGRPVHVLALRGHADPTAFADLPHTVLRLGDGAGFRATLQRQGARQLVLAGSVRRPSLRELRPDAEMRGLLVRVGRGMFGGDDGLLAAVVRVLGEEGYTVIGAEMVLGGLLASEGCLTRAVPDRAAWQDIHRGAAVAWALGAADAGQGCVVQQGLVLAIEAIEGTDAMLARTAALRRAGGGGVLVKLVKPGQERRADLPTLGPATIAAAAAAGLAGIACEAGSTLLVDRAETVAAADAAGLFLVGLSRDRITSAQSEPESRR